MLQLQVQLFVGAEDITKVRRTFQTCAISSSLPQVSHFILFYYFFLKLAILNVHTGVSHSTITNIHLHA